MLSVVRYVPMIDDPWGRDPASGNGSWYSGQPVLNRTRLGLGNMRGMSMLGALPTTPPMGVLYAHHPPLFNWTVYAVVRAFGFTERSFRLLPIVMTALAGGMLVALACRFMGIVAEVLSQRAWEHVEGLSGFRKTGRLGRPVTMLVVPSFDAPLPLANLARYGSLERLDSEEVARRLPTSFSIYRGPIWLLRLF